MRGQIELKDGQRRSNSSQEGLKLVKLGLEVIKWIILFFKVIQIFEVVKGWWTFLFFRKVDSTLEK